MPDRVKRALRGILFEVHGAEFCLLTGYSCSSPHFYQNSSSTPWRPRKGLRGEFLAPTQFGPCPALSAPRLSIRRTYGAPNFAARALWVSSSCPKCRNCSRLQLASGRAGKEELGQKSLEESTTLPSPHGLTRECCARVAGPVAGPSHSALVNYTPTAHLVLTANKAVPGAGDCCSVDVLSRTGISTSTGTISRDIGSNQTPFSVVRIYTPIIGPFIRTSKKSMITHVTKLFVLSWCALDRELHSIVAVSRLDLEIEQVLFSRLPQVPVEIRRLTTRTASRSAGGKGKAAAGKGKASTCTSAVATSALVGLQEEQPEPYSLSEVYQAPPA